MTHPLVIAGALLVIFATFAVVFMINGVQLIKSASRLPLPSGEEARVAAGLCRSGSALPLPPRE
jgi:hypothetical protein